MWKYISFLFIILLSSGISAQEKASGNDILKSLQRLDDSDAVKKYGADAVKPKLFNLIKSSI